MTLLVIPSIRRASDVSPSKEPRYRIANTRTSQFGRQPRVLRSRASVPFPANGNRGPRLAGTYDDAWRKSRQPLVPLDFSDEYFRSAPRPAGRLLPARRRGGRAPEFDPFRGVPLHVAPHQAWSSRPSSTEGGPTTRASCTRSSSSRTRKTAHHGLADGPALPPHGL